MNVVEASRASHRVLLRRHIRDVDGGSHMIELVLDEIIAAVAKIRGPAAAQALRELGIQDIHEVISAREVSALRDYVLDRLRQPLLTLAVLVGRHVLGWANDFYVDDYLILRINLPYKLARFADSSAENPGTGRLSDSVREIFRGRRTIDPVYDPKSYHRGHPPAAWAHGPHLDSWTGHSRHGHNIWWAISDVPSRSGIVLYPELANKILPYDRRTLYIKAGYQLPKPTYAPLQAGEMLVFDPEVLHGTHLNTTNKTRVAVSLRLNRSKPKFDPSCFYAREFWRRASDIEAGKDEVLHLCREDNLESSLHLKPIEQPTSLPEVAGRFDQESGIVYAMLNEESVAMERLIVNAGPHRIIAVRTRQGLKAYSAACPHYGVDLADGGSDETATYCPACAIGFELDTGRSACGTFILRSYEVFESEGEVMLKPSSTTKDAVPGRQ
jgi:nitrite reductase/ring-hydroxylating ferredoxin subunit